MKQLIELNSKEYFPKIDSAAIQPYAEFMALIMSSSLSEVLTEENPNWQFRLALKTEFDATLNEYGEPIGHHILATLPISQETLMKITPGTQATLTWVMKVTNKVE